MYKAISTMALTALLMGFTALAQGDTSADFTSIQDAVDAAAPGDTVTIAPGQYAETVVINKSITLQGMSRDGESPVVTPSSGSPAFFIVNPPTGAQVTIDGFTMNVSGSSAV